MMSTPETPRSPFSHLTPLRRQGQPLPTTLTSNITHAFAFHMMFFMEWHRAVWVLGVQLLSFSSMFGGTRHIAAFKGSLMAVWCIHYHRVSAPDCCRRASAWLPLALLQMVQSRAFYPMHLGVHMCILLLGIGRVRTYSALVHTAKQTPSGVPMCMPTHSGVWVPGRAITSPTLRIPGLSPSGHPGRCAEASR